MTAPDRPRSLREAAQRTSSIALLSQEHVRPLTAFVEALRKETGREQIPYFDPLDGGTRAECLFVLEAPGPRAVASGFVSRNNPDETAKNWFELNAAAGIPRESTITWNIVPWYIGSGGRIRAANRADIEAGLPHLERLLTLLPRLRVIALVGRKAETAGNWMRQRRPELQVFYLPHPSPLFVNRKPGNRDRLLRGLIQVREALA